MIWELGSNAPQYIIIVLGVTMITTVVINLQQYVKPEYKVDIWESKAFKFIPLAIFMMAFLFLSTILLFFAVLNIFCCDLPIHIFTHGATKIILTICLFCFCYSAYEFVKEYIEKASEPSALELENNSFIQE